jgi:hypothetical protein
MVRREGDRRCRSSLRRPPPTVPPSNSQATTPLPARPRRTVGAVVWFLWMEGMWLAFFALLWAGQLDEIWSWIRDLPLIAEIVLWIAFLPWMLGMAVWTSSWATWIRAVLVVLFAVGWTVVSIPRRRSRVKPR